MAQILLDSLLHRDSEHSSLLILCIQQYKNLHSLYRSHNFLSSVLFETGGGDIHVKSASSNTDKHPE